MKQIRKKKQFVRPRGKVQLKRHSFFKRHNRAFSIVGFVVVLLTFIVKEGFRDKLGELRDSISEAQHIEQLGDLNDQTVLNQVTENLRLRRLRIELMGARIGGPTAVGDLQSEVADTLNVYSTEESRFQRVSDMLDLLPGNTEPLKKRRDELKRQLEVLKDQIYENNKKSLTAKNPNIAADLLVVIGVVQVLVFDLDLIPLQTAVVESAKRVKAAAEDLYDRCAYAVWFFYAIGWLLGLGGSIYGWKTASE